MQPRKEVTKEPDDVPRIRTGLARRVYSSAIGKMLFTQDSAKLQKLCPYLHVVSLSYGTKSRAGLGTLIILPLIPFPWAQPLASPPALPPNPVYARERVRIAGRGKKITGAEYLSCFKKKNRSSPAGWIVILVSTKRSRHKKCLDRERMYFAILSSHGKVYRSLYHPMYKYMYGVLIDQF